MKRRGALPFQEVEQLIASGCLRGIRPENLQPASVDLSVGDEAYRVWGSVLPLPGVRVRDFLHAAVLFSHDLNQPLEPGATYLVRIAETVKLPERLYCYTNAKSSVGRNDLHVHWLPTGCRGSTRSRVGSRESCGP